MSKSSNCRIQYCRRIEKGGCLWATCDGYSISSYYRKKPSHKTGLKSGDSIKKIGAVPYCRECSFPAQKKESSPVLLQSWDYYTSASYHTYHHLAHFSTWSEDFPSCSRFRCCPPAQSHPRPRPSPRCCSCWNRHRSHYCLLVEARQQGLFCEHLWTLNRRNVYFPFKTMILSQKFTRVSI